MDDYLKFVTRKFFALIFQYKNREIEREAFESCRSAILEFLETVDIDIFTREVNTPHYGTWYVCNLNHILINIYRYTTSQ